MWTPEDCTLVDDFGSGQALSDEPYRLIAPLIPPSKPVGRPRTIDMCQLLDGLFEGEVDPEFGTSGLMGDRPAPSW